MTAPNRILTTILLFIFVFSSLNLFAQTSKKSKKEICITFDELPAARGFDQVDREAVTFLILNALKKHEVKAIGFVVGDAIGDSFDILGQWLNEGHRLGSMTFTNQDFNYISTKSFIEDVERGVMAIEPMLKGFGQKHRYFRYPFLHRGTTASSKQQSQMYLEETNQMIIPATVIPEDYLYNLSLEKLGRDPDSTAFYSLMNEYINHVIDEIERQEINAIDIMNRPIKHILLLRANRLNAVYLDELIGALKNEGYSFITVDEAMKDKVYQEEENYLGMKGIGFLERIIRSMPEVAGEN